MDDPLSQYFSVGKIYEDERGKDTVISIQNGHMEIERPDGRREESRDIKLQETIDRRISRERNTPPISGHAQTYARNSLESSYPTHSEAHLILAKLIENYSRRYPGYMTHKDMVEALLKHGEALAIIERIHDSKTLAGRAGVIIAGFSQAFSLGRSPWNDRFDGDNKIKGKWRFKLRSKGG
jgi:hypothetical protein